VGRRRWFQNGFIYLLILVAIAALFFNIFQQPRRRNSISISEAAQDVQAGLVSEISAAGTTLTLTYEDGTSAITTKANRDISVEETLRNLGVTLDKISQVNIAYEQPAEWGDILTVLSGFLPLLFIGALFFFLFRQARSGNQVNNLVRHAWKVDRVPTVTFADVGGMGEAKEAVGDIIAYLKDPKRLGEVGAQMPRAILVQGPPGVGKGLFIQAVAGEARVRLITANSSEFVELFCGVAAARVRNLFDEAKKLAPAIVFIDQLDAIGRRRRELGKDMNASEQELFLSQLFTELDTLKSKKGIVVFAATNRPDLLDPALLRAGRLERRINVGLPDEDERLEILKILTRDKALAQDVRLEEIVRQTQDRTGADLASIVNQAAVSALKRGSASSGGTLANADFEQAESALSVTT
jgi:cell division protease FtsH